MECVEGIVELKLFLGSNVGSGSSVKRPLGCSSDRYGGRNRLRRRRLKTRMSRGGFQLFYQATVGK